MEKLKLAKHLIKFVDESPSNYFACINSKNIFVSAIFFLD